jgi:hypothetical protein
MSFGDRRSPFRRGAGISNGQLRQLRAVVQEYVAAPTCDHTVALGYIVGVIQETLRAPGGKDAWWGRLEPMVNDDPYLDQTARLDSFCADVADRAKQPVAPEHLTADEMMGQARHCLDQLERFYDLAREDSVRAAQYGLNLGRYSRIAGVNIARMITGITSAVEDTESGRHLIHQFVLDHERDRLAHLAENGKTIFSDL